MADRYVIQSIRRLPMFHNLPPHELERLAGYVQVTRHNPGETVFRQWELAKGLYMVISGQAQLVQQQRDNTQKVLAVVGANQFLNEAALHREMVESASLVVTQPSIILHLSRRAYQQFLQSPPASAPMPPPPPTAPAPSPPPTPPTGSPLPPIDPNLPPQIQSVQRTAPSAPAASAPAPAPAHTPAPLQKKIIPPQVMAEHRRQPAQEEPVVGGQGFFDPAVNESVARFEGQNATEQVIHMTRRHYYAAIRQMWKPTAVFVLMLVGGTLIDSSLLRIVIYALAFVFPGLIALYYYFDWRNDWLIITDERVIHIEKDILRWTTRVSDIPVKSVQVVKADITDTLIGRIANFGRLEIKTAGGAGNIVMRDIPRPDNIQDYVFKQRTRIVETEEKERQRQLIHDELNRIMGDEPVAPPAPSAPPAPPPPASRRRGLLAMRFVNEDGDTVYRRHWIVWLGKVFVPGLVVLGGLALLVLSFLLPDLRELGAIALVGALFTLVVGGVWFYLADWDWRNDLYIIGDQLITVIHRRPLWLHYQDDQILLDRIDNTIAVTGGILRTLLNYGNVKVSLIGDDKPKIFDRMPDPRRMREEISQRQARARQALQEANDRRNLAATLEAINSYHNRQRISPDQGNGYPFGGGAQPAPTRQTPFGDHTPR